MADDYVCTLDEASIQKARDELHEDPKERMSQVETLRKWVQDQPHLTCPTDTAFLLRFLRQGKFSQLRSRKTLEGWLKMKTTYSKWFDNIDFNDPVALRLVKTGYILVLPKRDSQGRQIVITREASFSPDRKLYPVDTVIKTIFAIMATLAWDEMTMVNGVVIMIDSSDLSMKHQLFWGMDNMKKMVTLFQNIITVTATNEYEAGPGSRKNMTGRFKGLHFYNGNPVMEAVLSIIVPLLSKKLQERVVIHGKNMESVYKMIPMECLPREYLPDDYTGPNAGTVNEIIENTVNYIQDPRIQKQMAYESDPKWANEMDKKLDMPNESFRKLAVE